VTDRERRLGQFLGLVLAAAAAAIAIALYCEKVQGTQNEIRGYQARIERLSTLPIDEEEARAKLRRVAGLLAKAELRGSTLAKVPVAAFGREIMELLAEQGIASGKYLLLTGTKGEEIELNLKCPAVDLLRFLRRATEAKDWSVPYLSLRPSAKLGSVDAILRLGR
jgi:hypothetical protein